MPVPEKQTDRVVVYDEQVDLKIRSIAVYTALLAAFFSLAPIFAYIQINDLTLKPLIYVGCSGGLGGIVYNALRFSTFYSKGEFNLKYRWTYYYRPLIAVIAGIFAIFFITGGLIGLITVKSDTDLTICNAFNSNIMLSCALSFLVGFSTHDFLKKLDDLSATIFAVNSNKQNTQTSNKEPDIFKENE